MHIPRESADIGLLISGQASVLYGAAMFSEDVDLWIRPTPANARKLLLALADQRARVHRLTPALTLRNMRAGHGFHSVVPGRPLDTYLDIMARPPRAGSFGSAKRRARSMRTDWGELPVVHPVAPDRRRVRAAHREGGARAASSRSRLLVDDH